MEKTAAVTTVYERLQALQITLPQLVNEILRKASAFFAAAELDCRPR